MPLYEYECTACQHRMEKIQKRGARAPRCPECGGSTRRLISSPAIQFKGEGWYVTDYARKGKKGEPGEGKKAEGGEGKGAKAEKAGGEGKDAGARKAAGSGKKDA